MTRILQPEVLSRALTICFKDESDFQIVEITRDSNKGRCEAALTMGGEKFYISVMDEAVDDCPDAEAVAQRLLEYTMPEVVKSMPDFHVSVTDSGCILGSV